MICVLAFLLIGGCKKELVTDSTKLKNPDLLMSNEGGPGKTKVLRQSPGLKIEAKGKTIPRVFPKLQGTDKITAILNEEQGKKKQSGAIATSAATFTATLNGTYYNCYAELNDPGPYDWYLINWYTGVYTYIGSSSDYINFNVQKPSMYGSYRLWAEGPYGAGFTGYQYMGDPYTGVTINSGILSFTNTAAYDALKSRLRTAYNNHQTLLDAYDSMSDDAANAQAVADGFDEFLPFKEFEAHFGLSTLRAQINAEVNYWLGQSNEYLTYPEDNYLPYSYEMQTLVNTYGQIYFSGDESPITLPLIAGRKDPDNYGPTTCMIEADMSNQQLMTSDRKLKLYVYIDPVIVDGTSTTEFRGRSRTLNKFLGVWKNVKERQQVKITGTYYNGCTYENTFDSGYRNPTNKRRYSETVDYPVGPGRRSKSGELTTWVFLTKFSSTPYTLTYTH